ncbi:MAG: type V CRISPR-associated protein Cas12a/Cpf1 [Clostridium sp.]|nr:type V CRISPR-associated protein Cas12a/Cpf1 [Clostridium sp.]
MSNIFTHFTRLYSLSKTLRFELKPIGRTLENIEKKGLIAQDEQRAEEYEQVKNIIDRYHKKFISMCLYDFKLKLKSDSSNDSLEDYVRLVSIAKREEAEEKALTQVKDNLRKQIVKAFKDGGSYNDLFEKELIQQHLPDFVESEDEKRMVDNFRKFTTYFTGFHKNRKNMYSEEEKSTAIAYRLIHENLPMFLDNMKSFEKIACSDVSKSFEKIEKSYQEYLNVEHINEIFRLDYFTEVLTQEQVEVYNNIIGGRVTDDGVKIQGLNEYVNLYNQQQKDRNKRLPLLKPLYKMILSDRVAISWLPEEFSSDYEMIEAINNMYDGLKDVLMSDKEDSLKSLLQNIGKYDLSKIYIANDLGLTDISQQMFGQYDVFTAEIKNELREHAKPTKKERENPELYEDRINKLFKSGKSFSIGYLNSLQQPETEETKKTIEDYFAQLGAFDRHDEQQINLFAQIEIAHVAASDILAGKHTNLNQSEADIKLIKDLLDAFKALQHFIKPLLGNGDEADKDNEFGARLRAAWDELNIVTPLYNKVRNWLTRKPYSTEKIKLNFENDVLLKGWPNPEANSGILLRDGTKYYLGILDSKNRTLLRNVPSPQNSDDTIEYVKNLQGGDMGKNVQNLMNKNGIVCKVNGRKEKSGSNKGQNIRLEQEKMAYLPEEINRIRISNSYSTQGKNFKKDDLISFIDFYRPLVIQYYSDYDFVFKNTCDYDSFVDFTNHINQQAYQMQFLKYSKEFFMKLVNEGKLYLFQIWNKDFSEHSKGTPNLHTIYWKMLFDERNLADVIYKLNGQAEVFYRKKSLDMEKTTIHKANQPIDNKNVQNEKKQSCFDYDIVKNRRYTVDKFQFHVPITLNFKATGGDNINQKVLDAIRDNGIEHVIGIDRGERHLLYLSLIDLKGNIVKQFTLNDIINEYNGRTYATNYKELLTSREGERTDARRNWQKIENIKEIKEGYLSQVVHIITQMMVEYKAIVVLEDLNRGFMRGRQKIERQVYEKFEKMLIDKLHCYIDKRKDADEIGGALHPLQLVNSPKSFCKFDKQSGWLFYIPAWNTSKIDPVTGFVNMLDTRYENTKKARCFFSKFDSIRYNAEKGWFEFAFDYNKSTEKAKDTQTKWTLCTYGTRVKTFRNPAKLNQWDNEEVVLTHEFNSVFDDAGIDINGNLKEQICMLTEKKHLEPLMHLMKLLLQMRNSVTGTEVDYLLSPVADKNGDFYDSRSNIATLPKDADANGAYNIARKGLWAIRKIQATTNGDRPNLAISNKEWLQFAQQKPYLND